MNTKKAQSELRWLVRRCINLASTVISMIPLSRRIKRSGRETVNHHPVDGISYEEVLEAIEMREYSYHKLALLDNSTSDVLDGDEFCVWCTEFKIGHTNGKAH